MKTALITGISGQDGAYLARFLLDNDYRVVGTTRDSRPENIWRLTRLGLDKAVELVSPSLSDPGGMQAILERSDPHEIYMLAGQSSVGTSFAAPAQTVQGIVSGALNLLEAVRMTKSAARIFHASSSECFGDMAGVPATETSPFRPHSPYGAAKAAAHMLVRIYRLSYGLHASNGILFNHESPLRADGFVTRKIVSAAARIAAGSGERLALGRLDVVRDWGWAPEYVEAFWRMLQQPEPDDYVLGTGVSRPLMDFVTAVFEHYGLQWHEHVTIDPALARPSDPAWIGADPRHAAERLGWVAPTTLQDVARLMCAAETESARTR